MRNEIKISFKEPKYHIDRANKVIVCILEGEPQLPTAIDYTTHNFVNKWIAVPFTTKGVARLSPNDDFDEKIGMKVALAKAESKAYETVGTQLKEYVKNVNKAIEQCKDFFWKSANVIEHNDKYLEQF